jgi:hypothetical protein
MGPYRDTVARKTLSADTADGRLGLEVEADLCRLSLGERQTVVIGARFVTLSRLGRRGKVSRRELPLGKARLYLARGFPGRELALWYQSPAGLIERLWGVRTRSLLDDGALAAVRDLDRLADAIAEMLARRGGGARGATELGRGQHRVLLVDEGERLVVHARPLFRERLRRVFEVARDGSLVLPGRKAEVRARFRSRFDVTAAGDRIRFVGEDGDEVAALYLPWVSPEDRVELARRFAELVDPAPRDAASARTVAPSVRRPRVVGLLRPGWPLPSSGIFNR